MSHGHIARTHTHSSNILINKYYVEKQRKGKNPMNGTFEL